MKRLLWFCVGLASLGTSWIAHTLRHVSLGFRYVHVRCARCDSLYFCGPIEQVKAAIRIHDSHCAAIEHVHMFCGACRREYCCGEGGQVGPAVRLHQEFLCPALEGAA